MIKELATVCLKNLFGRRFEEAKPDTAVEAFFDIAIILFQLDKCLAVCSMLRSDTAVLPHADDIIILGRKFLQEFSGTMTQTIVFLVFAVSIQVAHYRVDNKQVDAFGG